MINLDKNSNPYAMQQSLSAQELQKQNLPLVPTPECLEAVALPPSPNQQNLFAKQLKEQIAKQLSEQPLAEKAISDLVQMRAPRDSAAETFSRNNPSSNQQQYPFPQESANPQAFGQSYAAAQSTYSGNPAYYAQGVSYSPVAWRGQMPVQVSDQMMASQVYSENLPYYLQGDPYSPVACSPMPTQASAEVDRIAGSDIVYDRRVIRWYQQPIETLDSDLRSKNFTPKKRVEMIWQHTFSSEVDSWAKSKELSLENSTNTVGSDCYFLPALVQRPGQEPVAREIQYGFSRNTQQCFHRYCTYPSQKGTAKLWQELLANPGRLEQLIRSSEGTAPKIVEEDGTVIQLIELSKIQQDQAASAVKTDS